MARAAAAYRLPTPDDRVVLLVGRELFLRTEHTEHLRRVLREAHGDCQSVRFDGASCDPAEVLDECRSFGLMATHKLVVVDDAELFVNAATRPMLERYCAAPSDQASLVLRAATWRPGNLDKAIEKVGAVIKCDGIRPDQAVGWAVKRAQKTHGATLNPDAAALLVERTGADLGRLDSELGKLAAAAGPDAPITTRLIGELVGLTREEEAWTLQSLLLSGDAENALRELRVVMGNGARDAAVPVSYACCDLARKLMGAAEGIAQRQNESAIARDLAIWGPSQHAVMNAARRISPTTARDLFDAAVSTDAGIKSGHNAEIALETLALKFLTRVGPTKIA